MESTKFIPGKYTTKNRQARVQTTVETDVHTGLGETIILLLKQQNIRTQKNDNAIENNTIEYIRIYT